jgi:hypothetical protein
VEPSNGGQITGHVPDSEKPGDTGEELTVVVTDPDTGKELCREPVKPDGTFSCVFAPPLGDGKQIIVTIEDEAGNTVDKEVVIDAAAPDSPFVQPSDGTEISGAGEAEGDIITVSDGEGSVLCVTTVEADGTWRCQPSTPLHEGDLVHITETDQASNVSRESIWRIGIPRVLVTIPSLYVGDRQTVTGENFQPGEKVQARQHSDPYMIGTKTADKNGRVKWTYVVPVGTTVNTHEIELRGTVSGRSVGTFTVVDRGGPPNNPSDHADPSSPGHRTKPLPFTGAAGLAGMASVAFGAGLAGLVMLLAAKRRSKAKRH